MTPVTFSQANTRIGPPSGIDPSQVAPMVGYTGQLKGQTNLDGADVVIVAWKPSPKDLQRLQNHQPIFLTCIGGLPPHMLSTSFDEACLEQPLPDKDAPQQNIINLDEFNNEEEKN